MLAIIIFFYQKNFFFPIIHDAIAFAGKRAYNGTGGTEKLELCFSFADPIKDPKEQK